jgi:hypothetical protein
MPSDLRTKALAARHIRNSRRLGVALVVGAALTLAVPGVASAARRKSSTTTTAAPAGKPVSAAAALPTAAAPQTTTVAAATCP